MIGYGFSRDPFAGQRIWHINGVPVWESHSVTAMTDMIDDQMFNHAVHR